MLKSTPCAALFVFTSVVLTSPEGRANPTGGSLQQGEATWTSTGPVMTVNQTTDRAVINWNGFSIASGETTRFIQPSSSSAVLNRVIGSDLSGIYGTLQANGQVYLINPNGIIMGANGVIKTGAFIASTLDVDNAQFMSGGDLFFSGSSTATIQNLGSITATGGDVHLIAQTVRNDGTLDAPHGTVGLAGSTQVILQQAGQEKLFVLPSVAQGQVINAGTIRAINAELKAYNGNVYAMAINNSGVVRATGAARIGGHVYFTAGGGSRIINSGRISANGAKGGGTINLKAAGNITVAEGSLLTANATEFGNGGTINVISSAGLTTFAGTIEATGTGSGSIGGNAEVSGADLMITGMADLRGPAGDGTLLYDPGSIEILASGVVDYFNTFLASTISTQLATANVTLSTANATNGGTENITLDNGATISWSSGNTLTLLAGANIIVNGTISNTGSGNLVLHADNNATGGPGSGNTYTISFGASGLVNFSGSTGTVSFYYDPTSYASPTTFTVGQVNMGANTANFFPYMLVNTAAQLQTMASSVNLGGVHMVDNYALGADIDLSGIASFTPIGNYGVSSSVAFKGTFNGDGHTISNLTINSPGLSYIGLFGRVVGGTIENVSLTNVNITGRSDVAGLVAVNDTGSIVKNASVTGMIYGDFAAGGLVGDNVGTISMSFSTADATAIDPVSGGIGSLVGQNDGLIEDSYATGDATSFEYEAGGLAGVNNGTIKNSHATGDAASPAYAGGLTGWNNTNALIEDSYATGNVSGQEAQGGLVGFNYIDGTITRSYATGTVTGSSSSNYIGGFAGQNSGLITESYATGNVTGNSQVGGLVGSQYQGTTKTSYSTGNVVGTSVVGGLVGLVGGTAVRPGLVQDSYATGTVTGGTYVGGLVGESSTYGTVATSYESGKITGTTFVGGITGANYYSTATTDNYWDKTVNSTITYGVGYDFATTVGNNIGATPETTAAMMQQATFAGFDFTNIWTIQENLTRPYFQYQPVISGHATDSGNPVVGLTVDILSGGVLLGTDVTDSTGYYFKVFNPGDFAAGTGILTMSSDPATLNANAFGVIPGGFNSLTGLDLTPNTLLINSPTVGASNSALSTALGSFAGGGNVFTTAAGNSITLSSGINLLTTAGTTYAIDGNLASAGAALNATFNGLVTTGTSSVTISAGSGTINFNDKVSTGGVVVMNGTGTVNFGSSLTLGGNLTVSNSAGINLHGTVLDNNHDLTLNGPVTTYGAITIGNLGNFDSVGDTGNTVTFGNSLTLGGDFIALGGNITVTSGITGSSYKLTLRATNGDATLHGAIGANTILVTASGTNGNIVLNSGTTVTATAGTARDLILAAAQVFENNAGSSVLNASGGTWYVYSDNPDDDTFSGLLSGNQAIWNQPYTSVDPALSGDRYLFTHQPTITFTSTDDTKVYGTDAAASVATHYTTTGFVNASLYGNVFTQDTTANSMSGVPTVTSLGSPVTAPVSGSPYVITVASGTEASSNGYAFAFTSTGKLTITTAALSITASDDTKVYGTTQTLTGYTVSGLLNSDAVSGVTLTSLGTLATTNVGTYAITASAATGTGLSNYTITYHAGTDTVTQAALDVFATDDSKAYGTTQTLTGYTVTGLLNSDAVSSVNLTSLGTLATTSVGTYAINASTATGTDLTNYAITYHGAIDTVTQAALNITANDDSKVYGTTQTLTHYTVTGLANSDAVSSVNLSSVGTLATTNVGTYAINVSNATGNGLSNYTIAYHDGTDTVTTAQLNITASDDSKVYGTTQTLTNYTVGGLVNSDAVSSVNLSSVGTLATTNVGTYAINASAATGTGLSNYTIVYHAGTDTITQAQLDITASDASKAYGTTQTLTDYSVTGLLNSDAVSGVTLTSLGTLATTNVGTYAITASAATGTGLSNYAITYHEGIDTVTQAALDVFASDATKVYGTTQTLTDYTVTGLQNSDNVSGVTLTSAGTVATAVVGPYSISASDATGTGLDNYTITYHDGTDTVTQAQLDITAADATKVYGSSQTLTDYSVAGLLNDDAVTGVTLTSPGTAPNAGVEPYTITASEASGQGIDNYTVIYHDGTDTVTPASLIYQVANSIKEEGQPNPTFMGGWIGFVLGEDASVINGNIVYSTLATTSSPGGDYEVDASGATALNYVITYVPGTLTVVPRQRIEYQLSQLDYGLFMDRVVMAPRPGAGDGTYHYLGKGWNVGRSIAHNSSWTTFR